MANSNSSSVAAIPLVEGSTGWYEFQPDQRNGFLGTIRVVVLDRNPEERARNNDYLRVAPIRRVGRTPNKQSGVVVPVYLKGNPHHIILDAVTTINPANLIRTSAVLSPGYLDMFRDRLSSYITGNHPVSRRQSVLNDRLIEVPTDTNPEGRIYVVLAENHGANNQHRLLATPVAADGEVDFRVRSLAIREIRDVPQRGLIPADTGTLVRDQVLQDLALPRQIPQLAPG